MSSGKTGGNSKQFDKSGKRKGLDFLSSGNAVQIHSDELIQFLANSNDIVFTCTLDGKIIYGNDTWAHVFKVADFKPKSLNLNDIIHPDFTYNTFDTIAKVLAEQKGGDFESVFVSLGRTNVHVKGKVYPNMKLGDTVAYTFVLFDKTERIIAQNTQNLFSTIANIAIKSDDLVELLEQIHGLLIEKIRANNFYVALWNRANESLDYPYYHDEIFGGRVVAYTREFENGLTEYVLNQKKPVFLREKDIHTLAKKGDVKLLGPIAKVWLGVPLVVDKRLVGVISIKSHSDKLKFSQSDLELLTYIGGQIGLVIERKRHEHEIREGRARLNAIFDSGNHLIWSVNKKRGLTNFNKNYSNAIFKQYSVKPEIDHGGVKHRLLLADPQYHSLISARYEESFKGKQQHFETEMTDSKGQIIWWDVYLNPIFLPDGSIEEVSGMAHNITQKKLADLSIKESETKFRNIVESFQDIYFRTDLNGKITMVSPSLSEMTGFAPKDVIGKKISNFFIREDAPGSLLGRLLRFSRVKNYEAMVKRKNETIFSSLANIKLIHDKDGRPIEVEGVVRDITSLKEANEKLKEAKDLAEKSLRVKESFLANMSHEIRTPMNGIIAMIDMLNDTEIDKEQKDYVNTIQKSSRILLNILNDILDLSKLEAGKMELRMDPVALHDTVEKLYFLFKQKANSKNIDLSFEIDPKLPDIVIADETRLLQVLSNLASNSIKFTSEGAVKIKVILLEKHRKYVKMKFEVQDTGIGISEENTRQLFQNFSQIDNSLTRSYGGTGLGLSISKELCRLMKGDIGVDSKLGEGSTFWFTLETTVTTGKPIGKEEGLRAIADNHFGELKPFLLLVDDNSVNQRVARMILEKAGCTVEVANNGLEAIEKVKNGHVYDVILMDIQMPVMDGLTATKEIKNLGIKDLPPIIAMTAYSMEDDEQQFLEAGMDDYLAKPITPKKLILKVKGWLKSDKPSKLEPRSKDEDVSKNEIVLTNGLNMSVINQLEGLGGLEMIEEMFVDFESETKEKISEIKKLRKKDDYKGILSKLHAIKGTAGTIGVQVVSDLAKEIEAELKQDIQSNFDQKIKELFNEFARFQKAYKELINSKTDVGKKSIGS